MKETKKALEQKIDEYLPMMTFLFLACAAAVGGLLEKLNAEMKYIDDGINIHKANMKKIRDVQREKDSGGWNKFGPRIGS